MKKAGLPWERAKAFNKSAVFGEFIQFNEDITKIRLELFINDKLIQFANFDLMIYKPLEMLKEIDSFMSLEDGDIVMSGTPKGVGKFNIDEVSPKGSAGIGCATRQRAEDQPEHHDGRRQLLTPLI
jgi:2-keto-4-pentenoate hydratase/2-oxohepta-3-ene-1,7-dioic acid hydratase in catechol pathway